MSTKKPVMPTPVSIECGGTNVQIWYETEHEMWAFVAWLHEQQMAKRQVNRYQHRGRISRQECEKVGMSSPVQLPKRKRAPASMPVMASAVEYPAPAMAMAKASGK